MTGVIKKAYGETGYRGETVRISLLVYNAAAVDGDFTSSEYSAYSNEVYYHPNGRTQIDKVTLSPGHPIVGAGRSIYIGKTVEPADANYSRAYWETDNNSVFTVDKDGKITGVSKGDANLTAKINNATATVPVSVYELVTNVEDKEDAATVEDAAHDAIEALLGDGETTGTDIGDAGTASDAVEGAALEGDQFSASIEKEQKDQDQLSVPWEDVWEHTKGWHFGSASGVRIALGYTQKNGKFHLVCNLTSLDGPVGFELPAPENLPPVPTGKNREYKLVTIHGKEIKDLPYTYRDGRFYAASSEFSDFVLVYQDTDCEHEWADPAFSWSENGRTCSVTYTCTKNPAHTRTETCEVTSATKTPATCSARGTTTYTAKYGADTSTKDVADIPVDPSAHSWGEPTYTWSGDNATCTATRKCANDEGHAETEVSAAARKVTKEPTDEADGSATYTATFKNGAFATQAKTVAIAKLAAGTFTVSFDANGGTGSMDELVGEAGSTVTLTPNAFRRDGHSFSGWNTAKDGGGTSYKDKEDIKLDGDMTLYAQWAKDDGKPGGSPAGAPARNGGSPSGTPPSAGTGASTNGISSSARTSALASTGDPTTIAAEAALAIAGASLVFAGRRRR